MSELVAGRGYEPVFGRLADIPSAAFLSLSLMGAISEWRDGLCCLKLMFASLMLFSPSPHIAVPMYNYQFGICSKSSMVKLCERLVQISDSLIA